MDLDKLQFKARVRSGWQAIDLGFLMARHWWRPLITSTALPPLLLLLPLLVIFWEQPFWAALTVWWLKPFWERIPLYLASRKVFDEEAGEVDLIGNIKQILLFDCLPWLLWRRFSFYRAFDAPVTLLEQQKGKIRRKRLGVLHGRHTDIALTSQFICFCCEIIVAAGLFFSLLFFIPDSIELNLRDNYEELTLPGEWIMTLCYVIAMLLVIPFHTLAGFSLYLNRRIELEAWDIEISFRSLAERKRRHSGRLVACWLVCGLIVTLGNIPAPGYSASSHDNQSAKQLIESVLDDADFGEEIIVKKWRFKNFVEENADKIPQWLIDLVEWWEQNFKFEGSDNTVYPVAFWLKVLLIGGFIVLLIYLFYRFRGPLKRIGSAGTGRAAPEVMFGLDVRAESLPEDVPARVMHLWGQGQHREALGLLYRAALSHLIERHSIAFKSSHTESECAALVQAYGVIDLSDYFSKLTRLWKRLAYGHQLPQADTLQSLCDNWPKVMSHDSR